MIPRWFRRKPPAPALPPRPRIAPEDRTIADWWGYSPQQWADLPLDVQIEKRDTVIWAPGAHTETDPLRGNL